MDSDLIRFIEGKTIGKKSIFLDTKYWILIRDAKLGNPKSAFVSEIAKKIFELHENKLIFCPVNDAVISEIMKQSNEINRSKSAEIIDVLSNGVAMVTSEEKIISEIDYALKKKSGKNPEVPITWTMPIYVFGTIEHPNYVSELIEDDKIGGIKLYEKLLKVSFSEILKNMPLNTSDTYDAVAQGINADSKAHESEIKSIEGAYENEFSGAMKIFGKRIMAFIKENRERTFETDAAAKKWEVRSKLYPRLHATALFHAQFRFDKKRRMTGNDIIDIQIGASALPNCDFFFTEDAALNMIRSGSFKKMSNYSCKVESDEEKVLELLNSVGK